MELWKNIDGYDGMYQISNFGNIRTWFKPPSGIRKTPILRRQDITYQGYHLITLSKNGTKKRYSVHRLVAFAFIPNPENKPFINHIDFNKSNNHFSNLEWCTQKENVKHTIENNRKSTPKGEAHYASRLSKKDVLNIKNLCSDPSISQYDIAKIYDIDQSHVSKINSGSAWNHLNNRVM